jgi:hypothetical protein
MAADADLLKRTTELALELLESLPHRRVGPTVPIEELRAALGGPMRISVSNWSTTEEDMDLSAAAILRAFRDSR